MLQAKEASTLKEMEERRKQLRDEDKAARNAVARVQDAAADYMDARRGSVDEHILLEAAHAVLVFLVFSRHVPEELEENAIELLHADIPPALLASGGRILDDFYEEFRQFRRSCGLPAADIPAGTPRELQRILVEMTQQAQSAQQAQDTSSTQNTEQTSLTIDDIACLPIELLDVLIRDTLEARIGFDLDEDDKPVLVLG